MTHRITASCFALALVFLALPVAATVVKSLTLEEITREADLVVQAVVERQTVTWDEKRQRIHTFTEIRVSEAIKGSAKADDRVVIRQIGGEIGGEALLVSGNATLQPGEEVLLFLDADERLPLHYVVGMAQGKYSVTRGEAGALVSRDTHGLTYLDKEGDPRLPRLANAPAKTAKSVALDDFKAQLRRLVESHRARD